MLKKILVLLSILLYTSCAYSNSKTEYSQDQLDKIIESLKVEQDQKLKDAYKLGHFHGVTQIEREYDMELYRRNSGELKFKNYIVAMQIKELPRHEVLLYKTYGFSEGLRPITTDNELLVFESYDRLADALYLLDNVLYKSYFDKADQKLNIIDNTKQEVKYAYERYINKKLLDAMENNMKQKVKGQVVVIDKTQINKFKKPTIEEKLLKINDKKIKPIRNKPNVIITRENVQEQKNAMKKELKSPKLKTIEDIPKPKPLEKKKKKVSKSKSDKKAEKEIFKFKTIATTEYFFYSASFPGYDKRFLEKEFLSKGYKEKGLVFSYKNIITSDDDTKYIKVLNKNIFMDLDDVELLKK